MRSHDLMPLSVSLLIALTPLPLSVLTFSSSKARYPYCYPYCRLDYAGLYKTTLDDVSV